jgi:hypothetical protein
MSLGAELTSTAKLGDNPERRNNSRYPLQEELSYRVIQTSADTVTGSGATVNMGSGGILFTTQEKLPVGRTVEVAVNWPAKLGGICPLRLVAIGRVVRSEETCAAVRIQRYEFKTRSTRVPVAAPIQAQASR